MKQKSIDDYRQSIYILKTRIAQQQHLIQQLQNQFSQYNVLEDQSHDFKLKAKLLEISMSELNGKERVFMKHEARAFYSLHFAVKKMLKACEILSLKPEMVFRAVDKKMLKEATTSDMLNFMKDVLMMPVSSINVIFDILENRKNEGKIKLDNFQYLLECFMIKEEEKQNKFAVIEQAYNKLVDLIIKKKMIVDSIWKYDKMDMPEFVYELSTEFPELSVLEMVAIFNRFDPSKEQFVDKREVVYQIHDKILEVGKTQRIVLKK